MNVGRITDPNPLSIRTLIILGFPGQSFIPPVAPFENEAYYKGPCELLFGGCCVGLGFACEEL